MLIKLPWPPSVLIPHAGGNWAPKARATKSYRNQCWGEALAQGARRVPADRINATITMSPPDRRRRDRANSEASFKAGIDGVADAIGVDDFNWRITWQHAEPVKGGAVFVELEAA